MAKKISGVLEEIRKDMENTEKDLSVKENTAANTDTAANAKSANEIGDTEKKTEKPADTAENTAADGKNTKKSADTADTANTAEISEADKRKNDLIRRQSETIEMLRAALKERDERIKQQAELAEKGIAAASGIPTDGSDKGGELAAEEYIRHRVAEEVAKAVAPMAERYKAAQEAALRQAVKNGMRASAEYDGFAEVENKVEEILSSDGELMRMDPYKAYTYAYLMARGLKSKEPAPERSASDRAAEVLSDPEVMKILEQKRAEDAAALHSTLPKLPASGGVLPATPEKTPKTLSEARALAMKSYM